MRRARISGIFLLPPIEKVGLGRIVNEEKYVSVLCGNIVKYNMVFLGHFGG